MAEWLGIGLQNRVPRFESGRCLLLKTSQKWEVFLLKIITAKPHTRFSRSFGTGDASYLKPLRNGRFFLLKIITAKPHTRFSRSFGTGDASYLKPLRNGRFFFIENNNCKTAHSVLPKFRDGRLLLKTAHKEGVLKIIE